MTLDEAIHRLETMIGTRVEWTRLEVFLPATQDPEFRKSALASSFVATLELARTGKLALQQDGVFGLLPHRRGPQGGHKLTAEVMEFVAEQRSADSSLTPEQLAEAIQLRFRIQVHPRSIQRRLLRQKKRR